MAAVFGEIGADQHADRRADAHAQHRHDDRANDGIGEAARGRARRRRHFGEDAEVQAGEAVPQQREQDEAEPGEAEGGRCNAGGTNLNTYGPRMHPNDGRVISNFIVQALRKQPITLYGDGSQTRSFCYVDDLVEGLLRLMDAPDDVVGPINLGNPAEFTIRELAEQVVRLTGAPESVVLRPLPADDPLQRCPNIRRARQVLGWEPKVPLEQGLQRTIAYFAELLKDAGELPRAAVHGGVALPLP